LFLFGFTGLVCGDFGLQGDGIKLVEHLPRGRIDQTHLPIKTTSRNGLPARMKRHGEYAAVFELGTGHLSAVGSVIHPHFAGAVITRASDNLTSIEVVGHTEQAAGQGTELSNLVEVVANLSGL